MFKDLIQIKLVTYVIRYPLQSNRELYPLPTIKLDAAEEIDFLNSLLYNLLVKVER